MRVRLRMIAMVGGCGAIAGVAMAAPVAPVDPSSAWFFDDNTYDDAYGSVHGTGVGSPTFVADNPFGVGGNLGVEMASADGEYVQFGGGDYSFEYTDPFSVSFWVKSSEEDSMIVGKQRQGGSPGSDYRGWYIAQTQGEVEVLLRESWNSPRTFFNGRAGSGVLDDTGATWNHVVVTYDGTESADGIGMYINGATQAVNTSISQGSPTTMTTNEPLAIGSRNGDGAHRSLDGRVDEVAIWDGTVLSGDNAEWLSQNSLADPTVGGPPETSPGGLGKADVEAWYKGESVEENPNQSVDRWDDDGDNAHSVEQATGGAQPIVQTLNGIKVLSFDGGDWLAGDNAVASGDFSAFAVVKSDVPGGGQEGFFLSNGKDAPAAPNSKIGNWDGMFLRVEDGGSADNSTAWPLGTDFGIIDWERDSGGAVQLGVNGGTPTTLFGGASQTGDYSIDTIAAGTSSGTQNFEGDIAEIVLFDRQLNSAERVVVHNYLASKYDLTLAADDHYSGDTPGQENYDLDVFGVGRNAGGAVQTAASAGLAISENNSSLATAEWVLAGHKVYINQLVDSDVPGIARRWERVWFLDETGSVDVELQFDYSESGLDEPSVGQEYALLYSSTNAFDFADLGLVATVAGDQISFDLGGSTLSNGYYALGVRVPEPTALVLLGLAGAGLLRRRRGLPTY